MLAFAVAAVMEQADSVMAIAEWAGDQPAEMLQGLRRAGTGTAG